MLAELKLFAKRFPSIRQEHWYKYGDREYPLFRKELYIQGNSRLQFKKTFGLNAGIAHLIHINPTEYATTQDHEQLLKEFFKQKNITLFFGKCTSTIKNVCRNNEAFAKKIKEIKPTEWSNYSRSQLRHWYLEYKKTFLPIIAYSFFWYQHEKLIDLLFTYALGLTENYTENSKVLKPLLLVPPSGKQTYSGKMIANLHDMALSLKRHEKVKKLFREQPSTIVKLLPKHGTVARLIKNHIDTYGWITVRHSLGSPISTIDCVRELKKIMQNPGKTAVRQAKDAAEKIYKKTLLKHGLSRKTALLLKLIREHIYLKTYRKEIISKVDVAMQPLFRAIATQLSVPAGDLLYLRVSEIEQYLKNNKIPPLKEVPLRKKRYALVAVNGTVYTLNARDLATTLTIKKLTNTERSQFQLKGTTANPGFATGKARVILSNKDIRTVQQGEIIVADMTNPNYIPALKKASAFITNRGGVLCHAAVLSRELHKPCIIGTGNATQIIKTGDWVKVDADKGVITINKPNKTI